MERANWLTENLPVKNKDDVIPTEADFFALLTNRKYFEEGTSAAIGFTPRDIVGELVKNGDHIKLVRHFVAAAVMGWQDLLDAMKAGVYRMRIGKAELNDLLSGFVQPRINEITANFSAAKSKFDQLVLRQAQQAQQAKQAQLNNVKAHITSKDYRPAAHFCRIIAYDHHYDPGARRHVCLRKKVNGLYGVSVIGSNVSSWYEEPAFETDYEAESFIKKIDYTCTKMDMSKFAFSISSRPLNGISDLSEYVKVKTKCGDAYMHKKCKYLDESIGAYDDRSLDRMADISLLEADEIDGVEFKDAADPFDLDFDENEFEESIERHENLNPKLWNGMELKPEVADKINEIVKTFVGWLSEDEIKITVKDIVLIGSNCSYNYTKDSDLDIHIVADTSKLSCPDNLYPKLYSAYRSLFSKNFDIDFYGIPVEVYVETEGVNTISNGIYSVKKGKWIKEPELQDIPEIDQGEFDEEFGKLEAEYDELLAKDDLSYDDVDSFIEKLYKMRKEGLPMHGEYGIPNLLFKEFRNNGYLDRLKDLKNEITSDDLSLGSEEEGSSSAEASGPIAQDDADQSAEDELSEASSAMTPLDKMREFDTGKRRENVKACKDEKLLTYYTICIAHNLNNARRQIEAEMKRRGLGNKVVSSLNLKPIGADRLYSFEAKFVFDHKGDVNALLDNCRAASGDEYRGQTALAYLLYCIVGGDSQGMEAIKQYMVDELGIAQDDIKKALEAAMNNDAVVDELNKLKQKFDTLGESLSQEISAEYRRLSNEMGIDLDDAVYGKGGFMETRYPNGFPDFAGDIIFNRKYWAEFEDWLKGKRECDEAEGRGQPLNESSTLIDEFMADFGRYEVIVKYRWEKGGKFTVRVGRYEKGRQVGPYVVNDEYDTEAEAKAAYDAEVEKLQAGVIGESLEATVDQDLEDDRTPQGPAAEAELNAPVDANELRGHEKIVFTKEDFSDFADAGDEAIREQTSIAALRPRLERIAMNRVRLDERTGLFEIDLVKERDIDAIVRRLRAESFVERVESHAGRYDFSRPPLPGGLPERYYTINGKVKA